MNLNVNGRKVLKLNIDMMGCKNAPLINGNMKFFLYLNWILLRIRLGSHINCPLASEIKICYIRN